MKQTIIFFEWPSCAGKSTAVNTLLSKHPNVFHINKDKIKWLISDYSSKNESYREILKNMLLEMTKIAIDNGLSVILEGQKEISDEISEYTKNKNIDIKYIHLEAPFDILEQRFQSRIIECEKKWIKISNTSVEWLKNRFNIYQNEKYDIWITLDTSILSEEEVIKQIEKYIWENK